MAVWLGRDTLASLTRLIQILSIALMLTAYFIISAICTLRPRRAKEQRNSRSVLLIRISTLSTIWIFCSWVAESILLIRADPSFATYVNPDLSYALFSSLTWMILLLGLINIPAQEVKIRFCTSWILALVADSALLALHSAGFPEVLDSKAPRLCLHISRLAFLGCVIGMTFVRELCHPHIEYYDHERSPLLPPNPRGAETSAAPTMNTNGYGGLTGHVEIDSLTRQRSESKATENHQEDGKSSDGKDQKKNDSDEEDPDPIAALKDKGLWAYIKSYKTFAPFLWPTSLRLKLHFPAIGLILLSTRVLHIAVPIALGRIINDLGQSGTAARVPWRELALYITLRSLDSEVGLSLLQSLLWVPVDLDMRRRLRKVTYDHLMKLSCDFHDSKRSGVTWQIMERGSSVVDLVHDVTYGVMPTTVDLVVAVSVFWFIFDSYMAFIIANVVFFFLWWSMKAIPIKTEKYRRYYDNWEEEYQQICEPSLNWTTVSYFNRVKHEISRYATALLKTQNSLVRCYVLNYIITTVRGMVLLLGLSAGLCLAAYQIAYGNRKLGDLVILLTYWGRLRAPLEDVASGFSKVAKHLVAAEKLLQLLQRRPSVTDRPTAYPLELKGGEVEFHNVSFSYDGVREVLREISFQASAGHTIALVGETGGGKSTMLKLIFRFYDVVGGRITIDRQDVRDVTLESLRNNIAVVPQDPSVFNQTIMENVKYAKLDATEEEVYNACKAAELHDKIISFTNGYEEKVGEQGIKLSGGELQRLAIARAILKDAKILLLDEATSSVDVETEKRIQASLRNLSKDRTTFVIAHRLSTIVHADLVLVVKDGRIAEQGTHKQLLKAKGHYHRLCSWQRQLQMGDFYSRSRSQSPAKKEVPVLINDISPGNKNSRLFRPTRATDYLTGEHRTSSRGRDQSSSHDSTEHSAHSTSHDSNPRGRSPPTAILGSVSRRLSRQRPMSPSISSLNADAPAFIPQKASTTSFPDRTTINDDATVLDTKPASSTSLPGIPEGSPRTPTLWSRRRSKPPSPSRHSPTSALDTGGVDAATPQPRRWSLFSPRRPQTQSEPFAAARASSGQGDGADSEGGEMDAEFSSGDGNGNGNGGPKGRRTTSAPSQSGGRGDSMESGEFADADASDDDGCFASGRTSPEWTIRAPANTPARGGSEVDE